MHFAVVRCLSVSSHKSKWHLKPDITVTTKSFYHHVSLVVAIYLSSSSSLLRFNPNNISLIQLFSHLLVLHHPSLPPVCTSSPPLPYPTLPHPFLLNRPPWILLFSFFLSYSPHPTLLILLKLFNPLLNFPQFSTIPPSTFSPILPDPSVMGASLGLLQALICDDPPLYKDLVPSLVSILKQITDHRLPRDFDYHRIPAPWIQVKLVLLLVLIMFSRNSSSNRAFCTSLRPHLYSITPFPLTSTPSPLPTHLYPHTSTPWLNSP